MRAVSVWWCGLGVLDTLMMWPRHVAAECHDQPARLYHVVGTDVPRCATL